MLTTHYSQVIIIVCMEKTPKLMVSSKNFFIQDFFLFCIFLFSDISQAQDQKRQFHFGALELPPYVIYSGGDIQGMFMDIFHAFANQSDRVESIVPYPTGRLMKFLKQGKVDCTIFIRTPFTENLANPIVYLGVDFNTSVIAKKNTLLSQYDDLKHLRLGVSRGTNFGHKIDTDSTIQKTVTQDYRKLAEMLVKDRVDAILGIDKSLLYNLKEIGLPAHEIGPSLILQSNELWLFCSRQVKLTEQDIHYIRHIFDDMRDSGEIDTIMKNYLP